MREAGGIRRPLLDHLSLVLRVLGAWVAQCIATCKKVICAMELSRLNKVSGSEWRLEREGAMRVPAVLYAGEGVIGDMDDKVLEQIGNVACLPGIADGATRVVQFDLPGEVANYEIGAALPSP